MKVANCGMRRWTPARVTSATPDRLVVLACAASAGIHAGLIPSHLREEPRVAIAFAIAVVLLLATACAVALRPFDQRVAGTAALLFSGLVAAYAASRTTGVPLLAEDPEVVDAVGLAAISVELVGFLLALRRAWPTRAHAKVTYKELA